GTTNVVVNPTPPTPTITPSGPTTFCAGGSVTLTSSSASGNQWRLNGSPVGGAMAQQYVASVAGDYSVVVTANGCSSAASAVTTGGAAATNVIVVNATTITAKTPAHAPGTVNVTVTNPDSSTGTLTNGYTFVTTQFDPNGDNTVDPSDIFYLVNYIFLPGPPPAGA